MAKLPNLPNININRAELEDLKAERNKAIKAGAKTFKFKGHEFDVMFAKYVIEYLTNEFAKGGRHG